MDSTLKEASERMSSADAIFSLVGRDTGCMSVPPKISDPCNSSRKWCQLTAVGSTFGAIKYVNVPTNLAVEDSRATGYTLGTSNPECQYMNATLDSEHIRLSSMT